MAHTSRFWRLESSNTRLASRAQSWGMYPPGGGFSFRSSWKDVTRASRRGMATRADPRRKSCYIGETRSCLYARPFAMQRLTLFRYQGPIGLFFLYRQKVVIRG